jgi:hypothetical protein
VLYGRKEAFMARRETGSTRVVIRLTAPDALDMPQKYAVGG